MILKSTSAIILKILGWKIVPGRPMVDKSIIIAAPHTSNRDFIMGFLYYRSIGIRINFLIKKEMFFFPLGNLLRWMGGIPVDRSSGNRMVEQVVKIFRLRKHLHLTITPEGTREKVTEWKKGFYYIARRAHVPIYIGFLDYRKKEIGIIDEFIPTDNANDDMRKIKSYYSDISPKHPERFSSDE